MAGSLVVGLLELFAGQGQNRFYRELEEWLSSITRVGFSAGEGDHGIEHNVLGEVLEHMAEQMDQLQQMFTKAEESRTRVEGQVGALTQSVSALTQQLGTETGSTAAMSRVAEGQERLIEVLQNQGTGEGVDAESRMRLRSIDVQMLRILEEISAGRQDTITELRTDLSALTRAITLLGEKQATPRRRKPTNNSSSAQES